MGLGNYVVLDSCTSDYLCSGTKRFCESAFLPGQASGVASEESFLTIWRAPTKIRSLDLWSDAPKLSSRLIFP